MKRKCLLIACTFLILTHVFSSFAAQDEPLDVPPGTGVGTVRGYTRTEPGHWEQTDIIYLLPEETTRTADDITINVELGESLNGNNIVYKFSRYDQDWEQTYTIESFWFDDRYYGDEDFSVGINIIRTPDEDLVGGVEVPLAVIDTLDQDDTATSGSPHSTNFTKDNGEEITSFTVADMTYSTGSDGKYYIYLNGKLPVGSKNGELKYILLSVNDSIDGNTITSKAYQYTWVEEPEEIEVPVEYGPIEYHDTVSQVGPVLVAGAFILCILIGLLFWLKRKHKDKAK